MLAQKPDSDGKLYYRAFVKAASTESATCQITFADEEKPNITPQRYTVGINDAKDLGTSVNKVVWSKNISDLLESSHPRPTNQDPKTLTEINPVI